MIKYDIAWAGEREGANQIEYSCYGGINAEIDFLCRKYKSPEGFRGIRLYLDDDSPYGNNNNIKHRRLTDQAFLDLGFKEAFGNNIRFYWDKDNKYIKKIFFRRDAPFYLVVAATSIYRLWDNVSYWVDKYWLLRKNGYLPYTALLASTSTCSDLYHSMVDEDYDSSFRRHQIYFNEEHMPFAWFGLNNWSIRRLAESFVPLSQKLRGMYDEVQATNGLNYSGRDEYYLGDRYDYDLGLDEVDFDFGFTDITGKYGLYDTPYFNPDELFELLDKLNEVENDARKRRA